MNARWHSAIAAFKFRKGLSGLRRTAAAIALCCASLALPPAKLGAADFEHTIGGTMQGTMWNTTTGFSGNGTHGGKNAYYWDFRQDVSFDIVFTNNDAGSRRLLWQFDFGGTPSYSYPAWGSAGVVSSKTSSVITQSQQTTLSNCELTFKFWWRDGTWGDGEPGDPHSFFHGDGRPFNDVSTYIIIPCILQVQDGAGVPVRTFTQNVRINFDSGSLDIWGQTANIDTAGHTFFVNSDGPDNDEVDAKFTVSGTAFNTAQEDVELWLEDPASPGNLILHTTMGQITGSQEGVPFTFSVTLTSTNGDLHGKLYGFKIGNVWATGTTPAYELDPELGGNPFEIIRSGMTPDDGQPETIGDPDTDPPDEWDGDTGSGPATGDPGNPNDEDMTKADFRDAVRTGVSEAFDGAFGTLGGQSFDIPGAGTVNVGPGDTSGLDGLSASTAVSDGMAVTETAKTIVPTPLALPSPTGQKLTFSIPAFQVPGIGALGTGFDVDLNPYAGTISILRNVFLLINTVLASYLLVRIVRTSSADS